MASYYPSSSNQDSPYHDSACLPDNMMYLNQTSTAASYSENLSGSNLSQYYSVEIPSVGSRDEMVFIPPTGEPMNTQQVGQQLNMTADLPVDDSVIRETQMLSRTTDHILDGEQNFQYQELSLSLGMQIPSPFNMPSFQYNYTNSCPSYSLSSHVPDPGECGSQSNELRKDESSSFDLAGGTHNTIRIGALDNLQCSISPKGMQSVSHLYEPSGIGCTISNSKYLKAAQQLLDELVNVHEALKQPKSDKHQNFHKLDPDGSKEAGELSPDERKNLHSKMTKLSSMLDEVDRRYNQYKNQMQFVEASFEAVAGCGAAKSYTRLALLTISRHFRCLRDAICRQIEVTCRSLGEQDDTLSTRVLPRLRYVDKKLRQQRTLQQLGVVQHSWRPQRGLPENSVSILRAWLFEHFLHPYPKDSEKIMLARQTGLTRSQVANWFINARVRLWKPMVEDMYKEEFGADSEAEFKSSPKHASNEAGDKSWTSEDRGEELLKSVTSGPSDGGRMGKLWESKPDLVCDVEMNGYTAGLSFTNVTHGDDNIYYGMMNLHGNQRPDTDDQKVCPEEIITLNQSGAEILKAADATYNISALGSFAVGNQVSLALGLQHSEKDPPPMPEGTELKGDDEEASPVGPDHVDHHHVDMVNQYRFCNPHLLPDFVA